MDPVEQECSTDANGKSSADSTQRLQSSQDNGSDESMERSDKTSDNGFKKESTIQASGKGSDSSANPDNKHYPPWWTKEVEEARRDKNRNYNRFRRSGKDSDWIAFKKARAFARYTIRNAKADYEEKTQAASRSKESDQTESSTSKDGENTQTEDGENTQTADGENTQTEDTKSTEESGTDNSRSTESDTLNKNNKECVEAKIQVE